MATSELPPPVPCRRLDIEALFGLSAGTASNASEVLCVFVLDAEFDPTALSIHPSTVANSRSFAPNRRDSFVAGRACARAALQELTGIDSPVPRSNNRSPVWPSGITGSITHTDGFVASVVAREFVGAVGIDAERIERTGRDVSRRILTDDEIERVHDSAHPARAAMSVFSAKEAFYKAQFQLTGAWVGFHDVTSVETSAGLELHRATGLAALDSVRWPVLAPQLEVLGSTGEPTIVSAVVVTPRNLA